ncbi:hypothetical protein NSB25_24415 [Acetatifactor muris]|uniref:Site-specific tyrosine recombinase XerS n=1 Tax=Acetatifactor muris TaxID=879566 RepID=A0A2K4ZNQ0_9FIRM|nr:hypothetical protein [Acetatifactor muris]MCR2050391.1 hypothetical protein [Acetatifactor muris]SOY32056.1 site-specific tyrosine recombinase XerS [Acetatifactor muris]
MIQSEKEQRAKEKVLSQINNLPRFSHMFFTENETTTFTTKRNYYIIFYDFLSYIKDIYKISDTKSIPPYVLENLTIDNIESYKNILLEKYSPNTVNSKINSIKGIFKFLYHNHAISKNIMSQVIIKDIEIDKTSIGQTDIDHFFQAIASKNDEFIRKRNLSIASLIIDTGLSVQDIIELNICNVSDDKIIYQDSGGNIIQYILGQQTNTYLKQYMDIINSENVNQPLFTSAQKGRISSEVIQNLFKRYSNGINPLDFQAKPYVKIKDSHNYILTINPKDYKVKESKTMKDKIKASELFVKLVVNSQHSMKSEDQQLIKRIAENHRSIEGDIEKILNDISMSNEYMRISIIRTTVITLIELGIIEKDVDILNSDISNQLISKAMDIFENSKH